MSDDSFIEEIQNDFLHEASDLLQKVEGLSLALSQNPDAPVIYDELARLAHNFKGSGKAVGLNDLSKLGHRLEDFILAIRQKKIPSSPENLDILFQCLDCLKNDVERLKVDKKALLNHDAIYKKIDKRLAAPQSESQKDLSLEAPINEIANTELLASMGAVMPSMNQDSSPASSSSPAATQTAPAASAPSPSATGVSGKNEILRIQKQKVDYLLEFFGEQVILQSTLERCKFDLEANRDLIMKTISQLTKLTFELQGHALSLTMVQIAPTFTKLERAARDAARSCDKKIQVHLEGGDTEVDRILIESLSDSLVHMVRNSVDHAIEKGEKRQELGKTEEGHLWIRASRSGGQLWIEVQDDGAGLDPEAIKSKAVSKGLLDENLAASLTDDDAYRLIFHNGFSTKESVSELSGRGVGMNVVQESVNQLKGSIEIESAKGKGTIFRLRLPLTLSIFNGAIVVINDEKYVIPNTDISEISRFTPDQKVQMGPSENLVRVRDEVFEFVDLRRTLLVKSPLNKNEADDRPLIINKKTKTAYLVDELVGIQKIVQKPLGAEFSQRPGFAAATIMSDGTPGVILNINQFRKNAS